MKKMMFCGFALIAFIAVFSAFASIQRENVDRALESLYTESVPESLPIIYDLTSLGAWADAPVGSCRMVGGWKLDKNKIQTEDGNIWRLNTDEIGDYDLLLIWFDDMGTNEITDDNIIKVWKAVYN